MKNQDAATVDGTKKKAVSEEGIKTEETRLIAEFMGYKVINYQHDEQKPIYNGHKYYQTIGELKKLWGGLELEFTGRFIEYVKYPFETDFNYLLPIIKRIEEQGYVVCIAGIKYQVYEVLQEDGMPIISLVCGDLSKKCETTYALIIDFIKWFNEMKLNNIN